MRAGVAILLFTLALAAPAAADHHDADPLPWSQFLPAFETVQNPRLGPVEGCRKASLRCVDRVERRLLALRERLGCDHRAIFPVTYAHVTRRVGEALREPGFYRWRRWLIYQDVVFAGYFFDAFEASEAGDPVPPAWQVAFDAWERGETTAGHDMLLGINAHVQRDMPFVLAEIGLRTRRGVSRKSDHEKGNLVLSRSYDAIMDDIGSHYDPLVTFADASPSPVDDLGALQLVRGWRETVWRNAERLLNATTAAEYAQVAQSIETHAELWARSIAGAAPAGYGAQRDAFCAQQKL
jgi:Family of unknown function (DUF5995)